MDNDSKSQRLSKLVRVREVNTTKSFVSFGLVALAIWISIIVASGLGWNPFGAHWNFTNSGAFGDSFGPISAFMASLAALSAVAAYREQKNEIIRLRERERMEDERRDQEDAERRRQERADLKQKARAEALDQKRYVEELARAEKATFEATFFKLVESFRSIVSETDITSGSGPKVARDAFKAMVNRVENRIQLGIAEAWKSSSGYYENDLNHYFRFLYHIINYVDKSDQSDKYFYVRLIRSSLSESELILIGLNCAYGEGAEKFRPLVEKYALLHNISMRARQNWQLNAHYHPSAFEVGA